MKRSDPLSVELPLLHSRESTKRNICASTPAALKHSTEEVSRLPLAFIFTSADPTMQLFNSLG